MTDRNRERARCPHGNPPGSARDCACHDRMTNRERAWGFLTERWPSQQVEVDALTALLAEVERDRDKEWAAALDPLNVGTDYGEFLADPKRAALLLREKADLERDEARAEVERLKVAEQLQRQAAERWYALSEAYRERLDEPKP